MFLHLSVSHSVQGGCLLLGPGGDVYLLVRGYPTVEMAVEAGGTHPIGMHSCLFLKVIPFLLSGSFTESLLRQIGLQRWVYFVYSRERRLFICER